MTKPTAVLTVSATQLAAVEMVLETNPITSPTLLTNERGLGGLFHNSGHDLLHLGKKGLETHVPPSSVVCCNQSLPYS